MRTFRTSLAVMLAVLFANSQAFAMSVEQSRNEAWFLTDKMAHELRLSSYQWDDVYEVNYDFFRALGSVYSSYTNLEYSREQKLMYILTVSQWNEYRRITYFYNPVVAVNGSWTFRIYNHYAYDKFFDRNHAVVHSYTGNHSNNSNYYHNRHVTTNQGNHYGNYNNNGNHNGNYNNMGNGNNHNNSHNNMNYGNNGNRNNNNNSNHNGTLASRTPSTGNSASSHVTQNTSRRH
ncbi:hypothetical protein [Sodaliphilus sp.]|uniref:hypothetical protein n=1 Tax=Sodaliphilus sp. TaxID=2815818 RepID=UPI00388F16A4